MLGARMSKNAGRMADLAEAGGAPAPGGGVAPDARMASLEELEEHRVALTGYCYRMLGSAFEAEDGAQETLVRAWRNLARFDEGRGTLTSWLYAIATNVCLDMLRSAQRRARAMDLGPASQVGADLGAPLPETRWVLPVPDDRVLPAGGDPGELAGQRETIGFAFVAALQLLPPRQRAVLILREVLCWRAEEVAGLLDTTAPAVNSALQRARATLAARDLRTGDPLRPKDETQRRLLVRYVEAFERHDIDTLVALLHEDATMSMPPFAYWLRGGTQIRRALAGSGGACADDRLIPTVANGVPAFGQYRPSGAGGEYLPFAFVLVEVAGDRIAGTTSFLGFTGLFDLFGLPDRLDR